MGTVGIFRGRSRRRWRPSHAKFRLDLRDGPTSRFPAIQNRKFLAGSKIPANEKRTRCFHRIIAKVFRKTSVQFCAVEAHSYFLFVMFTNDWLFKKRGYPVGQSSCECRDRNRSDYRRSRAKVKKGRIGVKPHKNANRLGAATSLRRSGGREKRSRLSKPQRGDNRRNGSFFSAPKP